jgi:hypothetical protein
MEKKIYEFVKTDHFLFRQWERGLDDTIFYKILTHVKCVPCKERVVVITPSFLERRNIFKGVQSYLAIVIKSANVLITVFWCDKPEFLQKKEKNIQILN